MKFIINIAGKEVELTKEECQELYSELHEFFGTKGGIFTTPATVPDINPWKPWPRWDYTDWNPDKYKVTCESDKKPLDVLYRD